MLKKFELNCTVLENIPLNGSYFKLVLTHSQRLPEMLPGQFVEIKVENTPSVYLRRPISISDVDYSNNTLSLIIKNVGDGTAYMSKLLQNSTLNMLLPLGNGFTLLQSGTALLVGGGVGIAPLIYLGRKLRCNGVKVNYLLGFKYESDMIDLSDFKAIGSVVAKAAIASGTDCEVSLENMMACGLGACLGCVTKTTEGHKCVCSDGPVFNVKQLTFDS